MSPVVAGKNSYPCQRRFRIFHFGVLKSSKSQSLRKVKGLKKMLNVEGWLLIRDLYSQGLSISEISRRTGYARETVRKYLNKKKAPEPHKRPPKPSKLDPYKTYIQEKINEGPYTAARLFREIKEMGYDGEMNIVGVTPTFTQPAANRAQWT